MNFNGKTFASDLRSGVVVSLVSIPEGMAFALVAGVDPIYGLYTGMVTTIVASLFSSTSLMIVTLTNAMALVTAEILGQLGPEVDPLAALFSLTLMAGLIMFFLGIFKLGSTIRYVSREVMSGFIFVTALLIVIGQYPHLVSYESSLDGYEILSTIDITLNISEWHIPTAILGFSLIIGLFLLKKTRVKHWADVLVVLASILAVVILEAEGIILVGDIASIPTGSEALPSFSVPKLTFNPVLVVGAIAAAVVGLAESSGIGTLYSDPDDPQPSLSKDFTSQGLGNIAGSFFQAMPASGSLSRTGINVDAGAMTRWAGVLAGTLTGVFLYFFGEYTELIPMTSLAAVLIVVGITVMIKEGRELAEEWRVSKLYTSIAIVTILTGVIFSLTIAIFTGVILSLLAYTVRAANNVKINQLIFEKNKWIYKKLPKRVKSNSVMIIEITGNVFFASVYKIDHLIPSMMGTRNSVIILSAKGWIGESYTSLEELLKLSQRYKDSGNRLIISEVSQQLMKNIGKAGLKSKIHEENIYLAQDLVYTATRHALLDSKKWVKNHKTASSKS